MNQILHNKKSLMEKRKELRKKQTKPEILLWSKLRKNQLGYKFRRQHSIGPFIVDFYCPELRLIIELDGPIHFEEQNIIQDKQRQKSLENYGLTFLRFHTEKVMSDLELVLYKIKITCEKLPCFQSPSFFQPPLSPPRLRRGTRKKNLKKTTSQIETVRLGRQMASQLKGRDIILLFGEMGAGKTTLVKGIAEGLGVASEVTSPTFTLMNVYPCNKTTHQEQNNTPRRQHVSTLVHIDTYRLKDEKELIAIGVEDYLGNPETVCIIEWPEKIAGLLEGKKVKKIFLEHYDEEKRKIVLEN